MIWTKGANQSAKFQTFDCSGEISSNLYFGRFFKIYKILAKKYRGVMTPKIDAEFEEKLIICLKNDKKMVKVSKTCTFICSYHAKYLMFDLKKYRVAIFHDTEVRCKI